MIQLAKIKINFSYANFFPGSMKIFYSNITKKKNKF